MIIADLIKSTQYSRLGLRTTICLVTLDNGYETVGISVCADVDSYDYDIAKPKAKADALKKLEAIEGFIISEHIHLAKTKLKGE